MCLMPSVLLSRKKNRNGRQSEASAAAIPPALLAEV